MWNNQGHLYRFSSGGHNPQAHIRFLQRQDQFRRAKQGRGRKGRPLAPALPACRSCKVIERQGCRRCLHREWPASLIAKGSPGPQRHPISSQSLVTTESPPQHAYREAIAVVRSNTVVAIASPCRRLRRNGIAHAQHMADRPPPHTNFRHPVHRVNPVKNNPNRGPWPRTFRSFISYWYSFLASCIRRDINTSPRIHSRHLNPDMIL